MKKFLAVLIVLSLASMANAGIVLLVGGEGNPEEITIAPSDELVLGIRVEGTVPEGDAAIDTATGLPTDGSTMLGGGDFQIVVRDASSGGVLDGSGVGFPQATTKVGSVQAAVLQKQTNRTSPSTVFWPDARPAIWSVLPQTLTDLPDDYIMTVGNLGEFNAVGQFTLMDELLFHCEEPGDVYVDLIAYSDIIVWDFDIGVTYSYYTAGTTYFYYGITGYTTSTIIEEGTIIDTILIHQVPEPATLALLGLGGLFLRRRKK
jgi:hypothetical protein